MTNDEVLWCVHREVVPPEVCSAARRRLGLELRRCGLSVSDIADWSSGSWWPSLRGEQVFEDVRWFVDGIADLRGETMWAETQILVRLPDEDDTPLGGVHTDTLPPWADGWRYRAIYGVELTCTPENGGGTVLRPDNDVVIPAVLDVGDVLQMHPNLPHSGSPNLSGDIRIALFYRLLERT